MGSKVVQRCLRHSRGFKEVKGSSCGVLRCDFENQGPKENRGVQKGLWGLMISFWFFRVSKNGQRVTKCGLRGFSEGKR